MSLEVEVSKILRKRVRTWCNRDIGIKIVLNTVNMTPRKIAIGKYMIWHKNVLNFLRVSSSSMKKKSHAKGMIRTFRGC